MKGLWSWTFKNLGLQLVEKSPDDPYRMVNGETVNGEW